MKLGIKLRIKLTNSRLGYYLCKEAITQINASSQSIYVSWDLELHEQ